MQELYVLAAYSAAVCHLSGVPTVPAVWLCTGVVRVVGPH